MQGQTQTITHDVNEIITESTNNDTSALASEDDKLFGISEQLTYQCHDAVIALRKRRGKGSIRPLWSDHCGIPSEAQTICRVWQVGICMINDCGLTLTRADLLEFSKVGTSHSD